MALWTAVISPSVRDRATQFVCCHQLSFSVVFHTSAKRTQHCNKLQSTPVSCLRWDTLITIYTKATSVQAFPAWPWDWLTTHTHTLTHTQHTLTHSLTHSHTPHTHTHTHTCWFSGLWGLSIGVMVFILNKLYVLLPYNLPLHLT